jgi:hypothetical protein
VESPNVSGSGMNGTARFVDKHGRLFENVQIALVSVKGCSLALSLNGGALQP